MAKQLQPASPSLFLHQGPPPPSYRQRQRANRPSRQSPPSSSLLSLLASLASASTAYGSPAPPSFLCPTLDSGDISACNLVPRASSFSAPPTTTIAPIASAKIIQPRHVPDRYSKQADGVWRRVGSYTLYGSTMPACTSSCSTPTAVSPLDDQIQVGDKSDVTTTTSALYDISTDLPPGWNPVRRESRTALILLISLFLALFIGSFIIGCMLWRKRMKAKKGSHDIEAEAKRKRDRTASEAEVILEKEIKTKQKIWARATARWRTNARYSARQRRGRRISSRLPQANQSSTSLDNSRSYLAESSSSPPSVPSSRRSSTASLADQFRNETSSSALQPEADSASTLGTPEHPTRVSPPAYHHHHNHNGDLPRIIVSEDSTSADYTGMSTPTGMVRSRRPSHSSALTSLTNASQNNTPTSLHAAHVATDDKALLARLAMLASAPPEDESAVSSQSTLQVSAPEWEDEDLESIAPHLVNPSSTSTSFSPMFPPPPSKERLAAAEFYDYSYAFEEMTIPELEAGPSAPPFEEGSAPHLDLLVPSAPPLFEDDEFAPSDDAQAQPSAPSWDLASQNEHDQVNATSGQNGDRTQSHDTSSSTDQGPSEESLSARDSVVLPGYQP
ncbi:hypothetical protein BDN70DRAFT_870040 [Pholiota conissans]|uniref:Uncharacterized protein n=1 Tax=Pholiota conissans TaxID=109636 RepID=A0A9P5ZG58_9AGAR|nr:hypothetical protein BDN70DRAFT_870040 [Pholiota conissans]